MARTLENKLALTVVTLGLCSMPAIAQECRIEGSVTDSHHAAVPNAIITVAHVDPDWTRQVLASSQGHFQLVSLPGGGYRVTVLKPGFKPLVRTGGAQCAASGAGLDLQMEETDESGTVTLAVQRTAGRSVLAYVCGLSRGSGCELLDPGEVSLDVTAITSILP